MQDDSSADVTVQFYGGSASGVTAIATDLNAAASDGDLAVGLKGHALHAGWFEMLLCNCGTNCSRDVAFCSSCCQRFVLLFILCQISLHLHLRLHLLLLHSHLHLCVLFLLFIFLLSNSFFKSLSPACFWFVQDALTMKKVATEQVSVVSAVAAARVSRNSCSAGAIGGICIGKQLQQSCH